MNSQNHENDGLRTINLEISLISAKLIRLFTFLHTIMQGSIYWKIRPPPGGGKYQPMSFGGKNMKREREKGGKCKRKRKKEERKRKEKGRRGKKMRKGEEKG